MPQTFVTNNRESLVIGQMPHHGKDSAGVPQLGEIVVFVPGINVVDSEKLKTLRLNKTFDAHFTTKIPRSPAPEQNQEKVGAFTLVAGLEVPDGNNPFSTMKDLKVVEEIVEDTLQVPLLDVWLNDEGRSAVRVLIERQRKKLVEGTQLAANA